MSIEHTPTPWYRVGHDLRGRQGPIEVCPATAHGLTDAKFILRAVNAYGPMLEALKDVKHRLETSDQWWIDVPEKGGLDLEMIDAAIALAEKED